MPPTKATPAPVKFTNVDKVFFPETGFTKGNLIQYYLRAAPCLLPHLAKRPITLVRFPDGVTGEKFYEKNAPRFAPDWLQTAEVRRRHEPGSIRYILIDGPPSLAWCANLGAIELHPFLHHVDNLDRPTHVAFDLDPGEGADLLTCIEVAFLVRKITGDLGLQSFPKVSGSKGMQIYIPLNRPVDYPSSSAFAKGMAELLERWHPDLVVSKMPKISRRGRVLIDWSQNSPAKTTVAVYSVRGKHPSPFVSTPVTWDELRRVQRNGKTDTLFFTPDDALARMQKHGDLFAPVLELRQQLPKEFTGSPSVKRAAPSSLTAYEEKRDFSVTHEPKPSVASGSQHRFVIQKHAASHLHYDFRLEMDGTLKSWAIPKGVPTEMGVKHSAFAVEDHPIEYLKFEGTIPKGQYGGGTVMVWDVGKYRLLGGDYRQGNLKLYLEGKKLKGEWHLFKIRSEDDKDVWLIAKSGQSAKPISARRDDSSAITKRSMAKIAKDNDAVWQSNHSS